MLKIILAVALLLALLVAVYVGYRVREWALCRRTGTALAQAEGKLRPLVFTGSSKYDRTAAALLAQTRWFQYDLNIFRHVGKTPWLNREAANLLLADVDAFFAGKDVLTRKRGVFLKAYVSEIDDALVTYSVSVPATYKGDHPFPLVVNLHGHAWFMPWQGHPAPEMLGAIVLSPEGRRATDFMWIGEDDVLRALEEVKRDYRIDEHRVIVAGSSMGGTGAWNLAVHYPHLFTAVGPRAGNCDFRAWEERWGWNRRLDGQHRELRDYLLASDSPITFVANLAGTPVYVMHSSSDDVVPVEHARAAVRKLRDIGAPVEYREYLNAHHADFAETEVDEQLAWLAARARTEVPSRYHFETRDVRRGRSFFVTIEQMAEVLKPAAVDVNLENDRIEVKTSNVLALTVHPADISVQSNSERGGIAVTLDGQAFGPDAAASGLPLHYLRSLGGWRKLDAWPPDDSPRKVKGVEGPVQDVFLAPFTVVLGTGGRDEAWYVTANKEAMQFITDWARRFGAPCHRALDTQVDDDLLARENIVFFGWPSDDSPMKKILEQMPVRLTGDAVVVDVERFTGSDVGTGFCYPTPNASGRMTAVFTALSPDALYQVSARFGNWFNWGVYDQRKWFDYCVYNARTANPETYPVVGFFGTDWSFAHGRKWKPTAPAIARVRFQGVPQYDRPPGSPLLYLSDLKPTIIDQMRGAVGFDRSFRGNPIVIEGKTWDRGLGTRCPSGIEFPLDGKFTWLSAVVGLTEEPEETLSASRLADEKALFTVIGDRKVLHRETVDWNKPAASIRVNVSGVKRLTLRVDSAGGALWLHGSSAWADARVER